nr:MAG TPA: hypothetical protein [Caudoviricetes sp.]
MHNYISLKYPLYWLSSKGGRYHNLKGFLMWRRGWYKYSNL